MKHLLFYFGSITCFAFHSLTLEEKVGQLLMVHFNGEAANEEARILVQEVGVGGIIYYNWSNGLNSPEQVKKLSEDLQNLSSIPLFIAIDQEGGVVARLKKGFTIFPGNRALGETKLPELAHEAAFAMGQELQAVGINMNFAPVVDINSNPCNPIIGIRSFGDSPEIVTLFGAQALEGYKQAEVIATLKHFPGHGDVEKDSHMDLPLISKSLEELEKVELFPFQQLASTADVIMTAHLLVPALDPEHCSTFSEKTLNYLKEQIGFQGIIISDSLIMEGALKKCSTLEEAAIQALNAGCDILLLGGKYLIGGDAHLELKANDIKRIHNALVEAVKSGSVSEVRINQAVEKILKLKEKICQPNPIDKEGHQHIAQKIASLALKITPQKPIPSLKSKKVAVMAPKILQETINQTSLKLFIDEEADIFIVCSYNAWKSPEQILWIQSLLDTKKPVILIVTRDPQDASLFPEASLIIHTYSPEIPSLQAVYNYLIEDL